MRRHMDPSFMHLKGEKLPKIARSQLLTRPGWTSEKIDYFLQQVSLNGGDPLFYLMEIQQAEQFPEFKKWSDSLLEDLKKGSQK